MYHPFGDQAWDQIVSFDDEPEERQHVWMAQRSPNANLSSETLA